MSSGRPPTLWWDFITFALPEAAPADSITSGYIVPWAKNLISLSLIASWSKISINVLPIIFLFCSGSLSFESFFKKYCWAFALITFTPRFSLKVSMTSSPSLSLNNPLSTNTHVSLLPMAFWRSRATTDESTPPESANRTFCLPTCNFIFCIKSSMIFAVVHSSSQLQISVINLFRIVNPCLVWVTSGWNWRP